MNTENNNTLEHWLQMETIILLYGLQMAALLGYIWIEFAETRSLIKKVENNILTTIMKNEIPDKSTTNN